MTSNEYLENENGTSFKSDTCETVKYWLEQARLTGQRVRLWYGDIKTGTDWLEESLVCGRVGRSTGKIKIPLLLANSKSIGGGAILDNCIVKLAVGRSIRYCHSLYKKPDLTVEYINPGETVVWNENKIPREIHARFKTEKQANRYIDFMLGYRFQSNF